MFAFLCLRTSNTEQNVYHLLDSQTQILKVNTIVNAMVRDGVSHTDPNTNSEMSYNNKHIHITHMCIVCLHSKLFLIFGMISKMCIIKNYYHSKCDQLHNVLFVVVFFSLNYANAIVYSFNEINKILKEFLFVSLSLFRFLSLDLLLLEPCHYRILRYHQKQLCSIMRPTLIKIRSC